MSKKKFKELRPVQAHEEDYDEIEARIRALFKSRIYLPLVKVVKAKLALKNTIGDVIDALSSGQIRYVNGSFEGRFTAGISKELKAMGAVWNAKQGSFRIPLARLPVDIVRAVDASIVKFEKMARDVDAELGKIVPDELAAKLKLDNLFDSTLYRVDKSLAATLTVDVKLSAYARGRVAREYTRNMQLYVKDWTEAEIIKLRQKVQKSTVSGVRYEELVKSIEHSYEVSQSKAKFLARQETNLLVTKFKQTRYQAAGVDQYKWQCVKGSKLHPVRPLHKKLDGKIFSWNNPPIVNEKGERKNPGQDYGCRCDAIPLVKF